MKGNLSFQNSILILKSKHFRVWLSEVVWKQVFKTSKKGGIKC